MTSEMAGGAERDPLIRTPDQRVRVFVSSTLYVADDPALRPVRVTLRGGSITASTTFSGWGERMDLKPPPHSLPEATLPPST